MAGLCWRCVTCNTLKGLLLSSLLFYCLSYIFFFRVIATCMGPSVPPDFSRLWEVAPASSQSAVKTIMENFLASPSAGFFRAATAMAKFNVPWNPDDYNGHFYERAWLLEMFNKSANNVFFLSGDLHDAWFWTMYKGVSIHVF